MAVLKKEYELSIWNEKLDANGVKTEMKGPIIGANDMEYLGRATGVKLTRYLKGTNTLTFQMPTKFFDSKVGDFVQNEFIDQLYNERKLKLKYKDEWKEFTIKQIQEDKRHKSIMKTFTCQDSYIDELSRTGYEIEFSPDLNNSVEESGVFMEEILEDSVWDYAPQFNSGDFTEFNEERFYKIPLSQFGGSISGYPIDLEVLTSDLNKNSDYYKGKDFKNLDLEEEVTLTNVVTKEERKLQYGDDMARVKELFWDPYYKDNGRSLLSSRNKVTLKSDYIYVPITDLSMIMGSIYNNSKKAIEEPALYGSYGESDKGYALQPTSKNPEDLIQFICFQNKDEVLIDEVGVLANNNFHYVIKIEEWNELLKSQLKNSGRADKGLIHWTSPTHKNDSSFELSKKYETVEKGDLIYTVNVVPTTRTIDDFQWYPVYYEGYLNNINETEVSMARNISISDRTELNKNDDIYVTVYNQKDTDFSGLYSESELNDIIKRREELLKKTNRSEDEEKELKRISEQFRICSKLATRQILPSLAQNLVENASEITDSTGWEAKTQNNNADDTLGTGSFYKLLEMNVQSTINQGATNVEFKNALYDGTTADEGISDYYLEILSPYIEKSEDFSVDGEVSTDYALNFGLTGRQKQIEKDKVYAIRLQTGNTVIDGYNFSYRNGNLDLDQNDNRVLRKASEKKKYEQSIKDFKTWLEKLAAGTDSKLKDLTTRFKALTIGSNPTKENINSINTSLAGILKDLIKIHDETVSTEYEKWANLLILPESNGFNSDIKYLRAFLLENEGYIGNLPSLSIYSSEFFLYEKLTTNIIDSWIKNLITEVKSFVKRNNIDLDKVYIGEGSINLQGNYIMDGIDNKDGDFISFADLAKVSDVNLVFLPKANPINERADEDFLTQPLYYKKDGNKWSWSTESGGTYVEDNAFLLFKATKTIKNPYIAIKVDSSPAEVTFDSIIQNQYTRNSGSSIRIQVITPEGQTISVDMDRLLDEQYYYVDGVLVQIYDISEDTFSSDFLNSIGYKKEDSTVEIKNPSGDRAFGELKDGDILGVNPSWSASSSTSKTLEFNSVGIYSKETEKSYAYALFIDRVYYGIFWLERKSKGGES